MHSLNNKLHFIGYKKKTQLATLRLFETLFIISSCHWLIAGNRKIARMNTIPNETIRKENRMGTIPNGQNPECTPSLIDTIPNGNDPDGDNPEGTPSRMTPSRMDIIRNVHNPE